MRKKLLTILLLLCSIVALGQYANKGNGALREQIWWLDWSDFAITASHSMTTTDGLVLTFTASNVSGVSPVPSIMRTWGSAMLYSLYDFNSLNIKPALYSVGNNQNSAFRVTIQATRNGAPAAFTLITADAEASAPNEFTTIATSGDAWSTIDFFRNIPKTTNPLAGCGTKTVTINDTEGGMPGLYGQNPILATSTTTGAITLDIQYDKSGAYGGMALAFGIYAPIDRGDLPASFGTAQHRLTFQSINSCNFNPPYPTQQSSQALKLGAEAGDADGQQTTDDNAAGADEDAFTTFPNYDGGGTYSLTVPISNTSGANAYLYGWFDKNNDKQFTPDERAGALVANNGTSAVLTWSGLPAELPVTGTADYHDFGLRLRFSSDQATAQSAVGSAPDGEVEDYLVPMYIPCTFKMAADRTIPLCAGTTVQLNASNPKAVRYRWTGIGLSDDAVANPTVTPATSTVYDVVANDLRGCTDGARFTMDVHPSPVITTNNNVRICEGSSTTLSASAAVNAAFKWSPATGLSDANVSNPTASPAANITYTVTATSADNCIATATVAVNVIDAPEFEVTPASQSVCAGETVVFKASGGDVYTWRAPDNSIVGSGDALTVRPGTSGTYSVEIEDQICHTDKTFNLPVTVIPVPQASVTRSNDVDCTHGSAVLTASGGLNYTWEPANGLQSGNGARVTVAPLEPTMYYVNISNGGKCVKRDSVFVDFNANTELSTYPMPNAFTPNNDGRNDCFGLKQWGPVMSLDFTVYNRWGQTVFRTSDPLQCWDGTFKGAAQPAGTYVFVIKARTACGNGERKGTVVLVR